VVVLAGGQIVSTSGADHVTRDIITTVKITATVLRTGKNTTGIPVPEDKVLELGQGKRPKVLVTVGEHTYRCSIGSVDGQYMISLSAENREKAGVSGGDEVEVTIELDTAPREVELPADFAAALENEPAAKEFFETLSYSNKRKHVLAVEGAKKAETRQRRIEKSVADFLAGKA
jgi:hypothetical protein